MTTETVAPFAPLNSPVLDHGTHCGIEWQVHQGPLSITGYARLPDSHPWIGEDLMFGDLAPDVHGGITYNRGRVVGFDCNHYGDMYHPKSPRTARMIATMGGMQDFGAHLWTLPEVVHEVKRLAVQAATYAEEHPNDQ